MPKPPFPEFWDSTMRKTFAGCSTKFFNEFMLHRRVDSIHLVAGKAFAAALETFRKDFYVGGLSTEQALINGTRRLIEEYGDFECPEDQPKDLERMIGAFDYYISHFPPATDHVQPLKTEDGVAVEYSFALPIPDEHGDYIRHPTTGNPMLYTGRFDMIGVYNDGLYVVDEKTTKQLGAQWAKQWLLRSQFSGYCWAARQFGYNVVGALIRGIAIRKTGYDNAEAIVYRPDWMIDRWLQQLRHDIRSAIAMWEADVWEHNLDDSCSSYGGCIFLDACTSPDPLPWLEAMPYHKWDPLEAANLEDKTLEDLLKEAMV